MQKAITDQAGTDNRIVDSALTCLVALLRLHGIATDAATLQQRSGLALGPATRDDLVRQARRHGLKSRAVEGRAWDILPGTPLPAIGRRIDTEFELSLLLKWEGIT